MTMQRFLSLTARIVQYVIFFTFYWVLPHINNQEIFLQAHSLYHEKNYQQALDHYKKIEKKGWAVWYNMGNCSYFLNNYPQALVYWKRAQLMAHYADLENIYHNCNIVEKKLGLPLIIENPIIEFIKNLSGKHSLIVWQLIFLILLYGTIFSLVHILNRYRYLIRVSCMIALLIIGLLLIIQWRMPTTQQAIILESTPLCSGTDLEFKKNDSVIAGQEVTVTDAREGWFNIRTCTPNKSAQGWIKKMYIELI